jgi:CBS-domain-containing membrane protein
MDFDEPGQQTVEDVYESDVSRSRVLDASTPLSEIVEILVHEAELEAAIVVDARGRFAGLVQRSDLAGWLNANLAGPRADRLPLEKLGEKLSTAHAEEACGPGTHEAAIRVDEPVEHALRKMMTSNCSVLAVVDDRGEVQGDVRLTRLVKALSRD